MCYKMTAARVIYFISLLIIPCFSASPSKIGGGVVEVSIAGGDMAQLKTDVSSLPNCSDVATKKMCKEPLADQLKKKSSSANVRGRKVRVAMAPNTRRALHRLEALKKAQQGRPSPKRGGVKKAIFKDLVGAGSRVLCCCSSAALVASVDAILRELPLPTRTEAMATLWPKVDDADFLGLDFWGE